jgi:Beta protein
MIETQVAKISRDWGSRPCLLDLSFLKFDSGDGMDNGHIAQLLEKARSFKCCAIPMIDLMSDFHRVALIGAHNNFANSGAALRVTLGDLNNHELKQLIDTQVANLGSKSSDCLLILDTSGADLSEVGDFAKFANDWLHRLRGFGTWPRIIFQAINYPWKNPAPVNGQKIIMRGEWSVWRCMLGLDPHIKDFVMFGDLGLTTRK